MICPRCQGCVLTQDGETRCLNCGYYKNDPISPPILFDPMTGRRLCPARRCRNCQEDAEPGKSYCQPHLDYFVRYQAARRGARIKLGMDNARGTR